MRITNGEAKEEKVEEKTLNKKMRSTALIVLIYINMTYQKESSSRQAVTTSFRFIFIFFEFFLCRVLYIHTVLTFSSIFYHVFKCRRTCVLSLSLFKWRLSCLVLIKI
jgi:hypothetical protein